jgi:hypothetical protein
VHERRLIWLEMLRLTCGKITRAAPAHHIASLVAQRVHPTRAAAVSPAIAVSSAAKALGYLAIGTLKRSANHRRYSMPSYDAPYSLIHRSSMSLPPMQQLSMDSRSEISSATAACPHLADQQKHGRTC